MHLSLPWWENGLVSDVAALSKNSCRLFSRLATNIWQHLVVLDSSWCKLFVVEKLCAGQERDHTKENFWSWCSNPKLARKRKKHSKLSKRNMTCADGFHQVWTFQCGKCGRDFISKRIRNQHMITCAKAIVMNKINMTWKKRKFKFGFFHVDLSQQLRKVWDLIWEFHLDLVQF